MTEDLSNNHDGFAEVRASRNLFSSDYGTMKLVPLPITVEQPALSLRHVPLAVMLSVLSAVGLTQAFEGQWGFAVGPLLLGGLAVLLFSSALARWKIGAGTISIEAEGFRDTRIGPNLIPWVACERCWRKTQRTGGGIIGVVFLMRPDANLPAVSQAYQLAFLIRSKKRHSLMYAELAGAHNSAELADVISYLVKSHGKLV